MASPGTIAPSFCADAFSLTPDPHRLFMSRDHAEALAGLKVGLQYRRGLIVVVGEVGMGKTTVAYSLMASLGDDVRAAYIANTRLPFEGILRHALEDFGVETAERDRAGLLTALHTFLMDCATRGQMAVLVIDEAQGLDDDTFENLRLLSNVETYDRKLLQIILLGQPELAERLKQPHLRQIAERVAIRVNINPLDRAQSRGYIEHRLKVAGGSLEMFSESALRLIIRRASGVPRRMNILCHNALLLAYAAGVPQVTWSMAREAAREHRGGTLVRLGAASSAPGDRRWFQRRWAAAAAGMAVGGLVAAVAVMSSSVTPRETVASPAPRTDDVAAVPAPRAHDPGPQKNDQAIADTAEKPDGEPTADGARELAAQRAPEPDAEPTKPAVADRALDPTADRPLPIDVAKATSGTPLVDPAKAPEQSVVSQEWSPRVIVDRGDTLMDIARQFYGGDGPEVIRKIVEANPGLSDPNFILAGSTLILPGAIRHDAEQNHDKSHRRGRKP